MLKPQYSSVRFRLACIVFSSRSFSSSLILRIRSIGFSNQSLIHFLILFRLTSASLLTQPSKSCSATHVISSIASSNFPSGFNTSASGSTNDIHASICKKIYYLLVNSLTDQILCYLLSYPYYVKIYPKQKWQYVSSNTHFHNYSY